MEGAGLTFQHSLVVGVADGAVFCLDAFDRRVACNAVVIEKRVRLRKLPRHDRTLRCDLRGWEVQEGERRCCDAGNDERDGEDELGHGSHLNPK